MKPAKIDRSGKQLELGSGDFPSASKLKNAGHPDIATIGKHKADIVNTDAVTLKLRRDLKPVQRQGLREIRQFKAACGNTGGKGQRLDNTASTKTKVQRAIGNAGQPLILLRTDIDQNITHTRSQIEADNLQPRRGAVKPTRDLDIEVGEVATGKPLHQTGTRLFGNAVRPVGIKFIDRPSVATEAEGKLHDIVVQAINVT